MVLWSIFVISVGCLFNMSSSVRNRPLYSSWRVNSKNLEKRRNRLPTPYASALPNTAWFLKDQPGGYPSIEWKRTNTLPVLLDGIPDIDWRRSNTLSDSELAQIAQMASVNGYDTLSDGDFTLKEDMGEGYLLQDMLMDNETIEYLFGLNNNGVPRKATNFYTFPDRRWPDGKSGFPEIPYYFVAINAKLKRTFLQATRYWEEHTCIKFSEAEQLDKHYVKIMQRNQCGARVGRMRFRSGQIFIFNERCSIGTVVHELGHVMGLFHEQQRYDRDDHIILNTKNLKASCGTVSCIPNFLQQSKYNLNTYKIPYDIGSIMHYGPKVFTDSRGLFTARTRDPQLSGLLGQRVRLSHRDKLVVNRMYNCVDKWITRCGRDRELCLNMGYTGANCKCICSPGTTGTNCQNIIGNYYDNVIPKCNREVRTPQVIWASSRDKHRLPGDVDIPHAWCVFTIIAPSCMRPMLTINKFSFPKSGFDSKCKLSWLEVKETYKANGDMYCGNALKPGNDIIGNSHKMHVYFQTRSKYPASFSANVTFLPKLGCDILSDEENKYSPLGLPINKGDCDVTRVGDQYLWKSSTNERNRSTICTFMFKPIREPYGLRIQNGVTEILSSQLMSALSNTEDSQCKQSITYCYHENWCNKMNGSRIPLNQKILIADASVLIHYEAEGTHCNLNLKIMPYQSFCHMVIKVGPDMKEATEVLDSGVSSCKILCKSKKWGQVQIRIKLNRVLECKSEWAEASGGKGEGHHARLCWDDINDAAIPKATQVKGYWYSFPPRYNDDVLTLQAYNTDVNPIIVKCLFLG